LYAERRDALAQALRKEFGPELERSEMEILGAEAGMHLVVTLPPGVSDLKISARAAQEGLWLWPLSAAYAGTNVRQGFVLGFGGTKADDMLHQVRRLRKAMRGESGYRGRTQSGH
jgi:GntR family transcriptional regulator/MocR family aminotransferase